MHKKIIVVGSSNTDMVLKTARFPAPGETIIGGDFFVFQGGKGANQAVAAARAGGDVRFVCRVGNDPFGKHLVDVMQSFGVDTTYMLQDNTHFTTFAFVSLMGMFVNKVAPLD